MPYTSGVLAVIFDFDDTLVPDSTTKLLRENGVDAERFWRTEVAQLVSEGYDPPMAYLTLLLRLVGATKPLGELTESRLVDFGATLDSDFYPGLPDLFEDLKAAVAEYRDISIEFYIISGGLEAIISGSAIIRSHFVAAYGCRLAADPTTGLVRDVRRCITFTEKTRYLFEIHKGIAPAESAVNPYLVNKGFAPDERRIPFRNMIYVGDGLTDIPCFSLVQKEGGVAFGVFRPGEESSAKRAFIEFLRPARVIGMHAPRYQPDDELGALLRAAVTTRCSQIAIERQRA